MKYRIVKITYCDKVKYVIEKERKFLWWKTWQVVELYSGDEWYSGSEYAIYNTLEEAQKYLCEINPPLKEVVQEYYKL